MKLGRLFWNILGFVIVSSAFVVAGTVVTKITDSVIEVEKLNDVLYVDAGNVSDIQVKIDSCPANGCEVIIPSGDYALVNTINYTSNLTLIMNSGAELYWDSNPTPNFLNDSKNITVNFMFYANGLENIKLINKGIINPFKIRDPPNGDKITFFNDTSNIVIDSNIIKNAASGFNTYNSKNIYVSVDYAENISGVVYVSECSNGTIIDGIVASKADEVIDLNSRDVNVDISNIVLLDTYDYTFNEVIDSTCSRNVNINNVVAYHAARLANFKNNTGFRFATCDFVEPTNINMKNAICYDCNESMSPKIVKIDSDVTNYTMSYRSGDIEYTRVHGTVEYVGESDTTMFHLDSEATSNKSVQYPFKFETDSSGLQLFQAGSLGGHNPYFNASYPILELKRNSDTRGVTTAFGNNANMIYLYSNGRKLRIYNSTGDEIFAIFENGTIDVFSDVDDTVLHIDSGGTADKDTYYPVLLETLSSGMKISQSSALGGGNPYFNVSYPIMSLVRSSSTRGATFGIGNTGDMNYLYGNHNGLQVLNDTGDITFEFTEDTGVVVGDGDGQMGITLTDEGGGERCCKVWSDNVMNCTSGAC